MTARLSSPHLIGRREELEQLGDAFESAAAGSPGVVLLAGDSGVGKSRLTAELLDRLRQTGAVSMTGDCVQLSEGEIPFAPIASGLRRLAKDLDEETRKAVLGSPTGDLIGLSPELGAGAIGQARLFESLLGVLQRLAAEQPAVVVIEDLHWADRSTRDLLLFLTRSLRDERLLLILTYRSDELHRTHPLRPFIAQIGSEAIAERIDLGPLTRAEVDEQLEHLLETQPDPELADAVFNRSEGNPFFIEELIAGRLRGADAPLPATLRDTLLLRVEALPQSAREVVRVAAVAGRRADHRLLAEVVELPEAELFDAVREAVNHHVLVEAADERSYEFRHGLLCEAVYQDLLPGERGKLHIDVARAIEADPKLAGQVPTVAAELAAHWYAAHELDCAFKSSLEAGFESERLYAFAEAQLQFERVLDLWDHVSVAAGADHADVLRHAATAAHSAGEGERAIALARALVAEIDEEADPETAAVALERLGRYLWTAGHAAEALPTYRRAVEILPAQPSVALAQALAGEAQIMLLLDRQAEARELVDRALPIARAVGARHVEAHILNTLTCAGSTNDPVRAIELMDSARALGEELDLPEEILRAYMNGSDAVDQAGRVEEAVAIALDGVAAARRLGLERHMGRFLEAEAANRMVRLGRWDEAIALATECIASGSGLNTVAARESLAAIAIERGDFERAHALLAESRAALSPRAGSMWIAQQAGGQARLALLQGRPREARAIVADALDQLTDGEFIFYTAPLYWTGICAEAELAAEARPLRQAEELAVSERRGEELIERIDSRLAVYDKDPVPPAAAAWRALAWAELARLRGEHDPGSWSAAASAFESVGQVVEVAYARYRQAEAMAYARQPADTVAPILELSRATAVRLGMAPLLADITSLARRARVKLDAHGDGEPADADADPAPDLGLTPREREVLDLVAHGKTNREIGTELYMSEKTASVHVSRILAKLGASNRAEAAASAERLGLVGLL